MDPSVLATGPVKPPRWWILVIAAAGAAGSLGTVAVAGKGTYDIAPFKVRLQALPAPLGETVLEVQPLEGLLSLPARAEAGTHASPVVAKATVVGVTGGGLVRSDRRLLTSPYDFASFMGSDGKDAIRSFAVLLGGLSIGGGALGGLLLSFGRYRRIFGGALAGVLAFSGIGVAMQQTYDTNEFQKTCFVVEGQCFGGEPEVPGGVPDVLPSS
jgi:hypothetical protein